MSESCFWVRADENQYAKPEILYRVALTFSSQRTGQSSFIKCPSVWLLLLYFESIWFCVLTYNCNTFLKQRAKNFTFTETVEDISKSFFTLHICVTLLGTSSFLSSSLSLLYNFDKLSGSNVLLWKKMAGFLIWDVKVKQGRTMWEQCGIAWQRYRQVCESV